MEKSSAGLMEVGRTLDAAGIQLGEAGFHLR